jgi:Family of unknown function (DUF6524)
MDKFSISNFLLRAAFALALVLLTFNPSGFSFVHMLEHDFPHVTPLEAVLGVVLLIGWFVYLGATLRSIGVLGMALALALFAALIWLIVSWGWITLSDESVIAWISLVVLALVLAVGMSWSHFYLRWSGQATVDETEER